MGGFGTGPVTEVRGQVTLVDGWLDAGQITGEQAAALNRRNLPIVPAPKPEPVRVEVIRYRCPFCSRSRSSKRATTAHIGRCWRNPGNRACTTCRHLEPAGSGDQCVPGQSCNCNVYPPACVAGVALPDGKAFPLVGCPSWAAAR